MLASLPADLASWLEMEVYGGSPARWALAAAVAVAVFAGLRVIRHVILTRLKGVIERTTNVVDDLALDLVRGTGWPFVLVLSVFVGSFFLAPPPGHALVLRRLFTIFLFFQVGAWANRVISFAVGTYLKDKSPGELGSRMAVVALFNFFARLVVWSVVVLLILDNLGIDVTTLIAGLGVGGIAIGLALQSVLRDTFASLSIILDKPFEVGDFVIIDEYAGSIEEIGLKTTRIRSVTGEQLVFGNDDLLSCRIRNLKRMEERRVLFSFTVGFETGNDALAGVGAMMREIVESVEHTRFDRAHLKELVADGVAFEVAYYVTIPDYNLMRDVHERICLELHRRFHQAGIRFAHPTRRLLMEEEPEAAGTARRAVKRIGPSGRR